MVYLVAAPPLTHTIPDAIRPEKNGRTNWIASAGVDFNIFLY